MATQIKEKYNMQNCPAPMAFPDDAQHHPHPPFQTAIWCPPFPTSPFPTMQCLKNPDCKKNALLPLSECCSDGWGSFSGLSSHIKSCCLWRSQILS
jgi:hypothetical protein